MAAVVLLALLLFSPLLFVASNLVVALESALFESVPSNDEVLGTYKYSAPWGQVRLQVNPDRTFQETLVTSTISPKLLKGVWRASDGSNFKELDFFPFAMIWDGDHDRITSDYGLRFYRRFGRTYADIDDDLGEKFEHE